MRMFKSISIVLAWTSCSIAASSMPSDCFTGAFTEYLPISDYAPAQAFCGREYPQAFSDRTTCTSNPTTGAKRDTGSIGARNAYEAYNWNHLQQSTFETFTHQSQTVIDKVCYCIAFSSAATTSITCQSSEYCDVQSGTCQSRRNCNNPAQCDASSVCYNQNSQACFCHPDTDDPSAGYCMGDGPAGAPCPEVYEDCTSNSDCGEAGVCIYACCRDEPFCIVLDEYGCENYMAPSRLFRRTSRDDNEEDEGASAYDAHDFMTQKRMHLGWQEGEDSQFEPSDASKNELLDEGMPQISNAWRSLQPAEILSDKFVPTTRFTQRLHVIDVYTSGMFGASPAKSASRL